MLRRAPILLGMLLVASGARAASFPTRAGETGLLDVPSAEVALPGGGLLGAEFGLQRIGGQPAEANPLPLSVVAGLGRGLEAGMSIRDGGRPGDPRPSPTLFGAALKLRLLEADGYSPAVALDLNVDRFNWNAVTTARAIASTARIGKLHFASYLGLEGHGPGLSVGPTAGLASAISLTPRTDTVFEVAAGPRGPLVGGALRYAVDARTGLSFGVDWLPRDSGVRFSIGVAFEAIGPRARVRRAPPPPKPAAQAAAQGPKQPVFADDRPRFRLVMPAVAPSTDRRQRHLQYGPWLDQRTALAKASPSSPGDRSAGALAKGAGVSSLDAEARALDRRQAAIDEFERRLAAAGAAATAREKQLTADGERLAASEKQLQSRANEQVNKERAFPPLARPDERQRQLLVTLQSMCTHEVELETAEQTSAVASSAAEQRSAQAAIREQRATEEAKQLEQRLAAAEPGHRRNLSRRDLLDAREHRLLAVQERLAAQQDRLDAVQRAATARTQRLASLEKRIGLAADLLALRTEGKLGGPGAAAAQSKAAVAAAAPAAAAPAAAAPAASALAAAAKAAPSSSAAVASIAPPAPPVLPAPAAVVPAPAPQAPPSWTGEKLVIAAGLISLSTPEQPLDEFDRQTIGAIARQVASTPAAMITVVARARTEELLAAAAKRGAEVKAALAAAGPVPAARIEVRPIVHAREGAVGVVISAFRYATPPAAPAARPEPVRSSP